MGALQAPLAGTAQPSNTPVSTNLEDGIIDYRGNSSPFGFFHGPRILFSGLFRFITVAMFIR
ncbi:hypothetical protein BR93DRAFT_964428 [Coniochaeta sp. PMI_546]|nr:hypothetical protein BR93DRAFT_964428 [Coniochaeta sp. PMI_546]